MNTTNDNSQPKPPHQSALLATLKKLAAIALALLGIAFILWLDSWFMNHSDLPKLGRDMSYGLLVLIGFLTSFHLRP
ncbi:MAG: hypothetical protein QX198_07525 [Methylococcaceae bacterium]